MFGMEHKLVAAAILACLAVSGCGGGMQLGGPPADPISETLAGDDPADGGVINEGTGSVIQ